MGIKGPSQRSVNQYFIDVIEIVNEEVRNTLTYLSEQSVKRIRDRSSEESWIDDTGNLRSSIGYAIYEYGRTTIESSFPIVREGSEGAQRGQEYINDLAGLFSTAYAAVVVAAMEYAEYVEAKKNKDVLFSTHQWAKEKLESYLQRAINKAQIRIQALDIR